MKHNLSKFVNTVFPQGSTLAKTVFILLTAFLSIGIKAQTVTTLVPEFPGDGEISFDAQGNIYVNDSGENGNLDGKSVYVVDPIDGTFNLFHDNLPVWVVGSMFDLNGNLLVTGWSAGTISSITADGSMHTNIVGGISGAGSLEVNELGHIFCAEYLTDSVLVFDGVTNPPVYATEGTIEHPAGLAYEQSTGRLYVSNWTNSTISVIDPVTHQSSQFATIGVPNVGPIKIIGDYMLATSPQYHVIYKIEMANPSNVELFAGIVGLPGNQDGALSFATFNTPTGIGSLDGQTVYVSEQYEYGTGLITGRLRVIEGANLGMGETTPEPTISIYPNPASNQINISTKSNLSNFDFKDMKLEIFDVSGKSLCFQTLITQPNRLALNIEGLGEGMYFLTISNAKKDVSYNYKFLKF